MNINMIKEVKKGNKNCKICGGTGYYTVYTDRAGEDGGEYSTTYPCKCNKTIYQSKRKENKL